MLNNLYKNKFINTAAIAIFVIAILGGAYFFGYENGSDNPKVTVIKGVNNIEEGKEAGVDFSLFWEAWDTLKENFVDSDKLTNEKLLYGAISGLMSATEDPYTVFMPPVEASDFNQEISGEFGGIGAELGIKENLLTVVAPLKNTPAENAGLKAGDRIVQINGEPTAGITTDDAVKKIRGKKGTPVTLTIFRNGWSKPKDFTITRDTIQIPTLDWEIIDASGEKNSDGKIVYAQLYNFYEKAPMLFYEMAVRSMFNNPKGVILDLRNNPGGYLEASVSIASWFLNRGDVVVSEKFQSGEKEDLKSPNTGVFRNIPVVVLINQGSASASEILAGALRDNRNIKLIGEKSFGKGSVQELEELPDSSQIKVTVAHWLTPSGLVIDKNGLVPDYEVEITEQDIEDEKDPQFEKALEIINSEISK